MTIELNDNQKTRIQRYIEAKDGNRPHLMTGVFSESAVLSMKVKTDSISFPADSVGVEAVTDVLVRNFGKTYENVYTFCFSDSFGQDSDGLLSCRWLVGMSEKDTKNVRVGYGEYHWRFSEGDRGLVEHLTITIEKMLELAPATSQQIMPWLEQLPYPFCHSQEVYQSMPEVESLSFDPLS